MAIARVAFATLGFLLSACAAAPGPQTLPAPHSNNAVALAQGRGGPTLYSFNGLTAGKTQADTSRRAFACPLDKPCRQLADVPVAEGRLASTAVTVANTIYLFGGYSVAPDGSEVSTPDVLAFDPVSEDWSRRADMPIPVDDTVSFAYKDRYIYLVSGWHDNGNVSAVQVYDTHTDRWSRATDYPGAPVFGHAGGRVGNKITIAGGVTVIGMVEGKRQFGLSNEAWLGTIDSDNPAKIGWRKLPPFPGIGRYRMAARGDAQRGQIIFAGGGDNAYNYNGVGYDGVQAKPGKCIFAWDVSEPGWVELGDMPAARMDSRGLLKVEDRYFLIGGLDDRLKVLNTVTEFTIEGPDEN